MIVKLTYVLNDGKKTIQRDLFSVKGTNQQSGTGPDSRTDYHERSLERSVYSMLRPRR